MIDEKKLAELALKARYNAYAPYSGYTVGAAVLAEDGNIYCGRNIENASYPAGICAERTAIFKAVSEGNSKIIALALSASRAGEEASDYPSPCGICRQVMSEFCKGDFEIVLFDGNGEKIIPLDNLLPYSFTGENL